MPLYLSLREKRPGREKARAPCWPNLCAKMFFVSFFPPVLSSPHEKSMSFAAPLENDPAKAGLEPCAVAPHQSNCVLHPLGIFLNFAEAKLVEVRGFEPLTFSFRTRRS